MLFYVNEKYITSVNNILNNLIIHQYDDFLNAPLQIENGKYILDYQHSVFIPIYIYPIFNLNNLNTQLLFIYSVNNKSYRFIKNVSHNIYDYITMLAISENHIKQPILKFVYNNHIHHTKLYRGIMNDMMAIRLFDNYEYAYAMNHKLKYMYDFNKLYGIDLYKSLKLVKQYNDDDEIFFSISIFGSIYYLYDFIYNLLPNMFHNYKQNWHILNDCYFNNTFQCSYEYKSYQVTIPFLSFNDKKKVQKYFNKLLAKLKFMNCFH